MVDILGFCFDVLSSFVTRGGLNLFLPLAYLFALVSAFDIILSFLRR